MAQSFAELFRSYPNRNAELKAVALKLYEFGRTIAVEPSAGVTQGLDKFAIARQRSYLTQALGFADALNASPVPDRPGSHPTDFPVDLSRPYETFYQEEGENGARLPLNEHSNLLAELWMMTAVDMINSQSAALAGGLLSFDHVRAVENFKSISKLLDVIEDLAPVDLPETASAAALLGSIHGDTA